MVKIVTDSTCDLIEAWLSPGIVTVVPTSIHFGNDSFFEGVTISSREFYRRIDETGVIPKTSQPSPGKFAETYRHLAAQGATEIISMHVTSKLSGTCNSAEQAARDVAGEVKVHVFDSGCGSAGLGFQVWEAAEMVQAGRTSSEVLARLETIRSRMRIFLTPATLKYLQLSGRVSKLQGAIGTLLNVKPMIVLSDGYLEATERVRTRNKALDRLLEMTAEVVGTKARVNLAVVHAESPGEAEQLLARARQQFNIDRSFVHDLAISVATHLGLGTVGIVVYQV